MPPLPTSKGLVHVNTKDYKIIGIVGSRRRNSANDLVLCCIELDKIFNDGDWIVSGGCPLGGDSFAEHIAKARGMSIIIHYPNKQRDGIPDCYFARNTLIARDCDVLIALVAEDRKGGTEDTVKKALKLGKLVIYA